MFRAILFAIIGGILNRWRGSGKLPSTLWLNYLVKSKTPKIIIMGISYCLCLYFVGVINFKFLLPIFVWFVFAFSFGWGLCFDMGRADNYKGDRRNKWYYLWLNYFFSDNEGSWERGQRTYKDYLFMTVRGLMITAPIGLFIMEPLLAISGALMGICYEIGWVLYEKKIVKWIKDPIALSEFLFGFVLFGTIGLLTI